MKSKRMQQFARSITLLRERVESFDNYPYSIPAISHLDTLDFHPQVTFLVGENGSGKSTLIEAIAVAAGFNAEGGGRNYSFATRRSESPLHACLRLVRGTVRPRDGYFLRAESYFNVATEIERLDAEPGGPPIIDFYGGRSLHEQSHGESFLALAKNRLRGHGLYLFDEPEAALSPSRQMSFLSIMKRLVDESSQFIIATHSPILMAYPGAWIYELSNTGARRVAFEDTEHYRLTRAFLQNPERMLKELFAEESP